MLTTFWQALGRRLAERWGNIAAPAVLFWAGGLLAWIWGHGGTDAWRQLEGGVMARTGAEQVVLAVAALVVVAASGVVVRRLALLVVRALEGYWPVLRS